MKRASLYLVSGAAQLFGVFSSAQAQVTAGQAPSTPATAAIKPGTPVSELVVVGGAAPKVSATFPADKTEVPGGILVVKVVFDQPMTANAWSFGPLDGSLFPHCLAQPRLLADHRTSVLLCSVAAHQSYVMRINPTPGFVADGGRAAQPFTPWTRLASRMPTSRSCSGTTTARACPHRRPRRPAKGWRHDRRPSCRIPRRGWAVPCRSPAASGP